MTEEKKKRPVSLRRLAQACGLSYQSVSRILNGETEKHNPATVSMVMEQAQRLGYRRNLLARGALTGQSQMVGVILPFQVNYEMNTRITVGIQRELVEAHYMTVACTADGTDRDMKNILQLIEHRVDGVVFRAHPTGLTDPIIEALHHYNIPVISVVDNDPALMGAVDYVVSDETMLGRLAAEYLWELGHRHFGFTRYGETRFDFMLQKRFLAFEERLKAYGKRFTLVTTPPSESSDADFEAICNLLRRTPRPTAIFASVDDIAYTVYRACDLLGLRIPDDLSVLGSMNLRSSNFVSPPLASFDQQPELIGQIAARRLLQRISAKDRRLPVETREVPPLLVPRASAAAIDIRKKRSIHK